MFEGDLTLVGLIVAIIGLLIATLSALFGLWTLPPGTASGRLSTPFRMLNPLVSANQQGRFISWLMGILAVGLCGLLPIWLLIHPYAEPGFWRWTVRGLAGWVLVSFGYFLHFVYRFNRDTPPIKPDLPTKFKGQVRATQPTRRLWDWFGRTGGKP